MPEEIFKPSWSSSFLIVNAVASAAAVELPIECNQVVLTNESATARAYAIVTSYSGSEPMPGIVPTTDLGLEILPLQQVRVGINQGRKVIRAIATAADGNLHVMPGKG